MSNTLFAQLDKGYIKFFKKTPKSFVLNVITEKEKNGTFIYKKHVKYVAEIQDYLMINPNLSFNSVDIYFGGELTKSVKFENNNPSKIASYITYLYNKKRKHCT